MDQVIEVGKFLFEKGPSILAALVAALSALIALFMLIPGDEPERTLKRIVDFLGKFSRK